MNPRGMESDPYVTKEKLILIEDDPFQGSILLSSPKSIDQYVFLVNRFFEPGGQS